MVRFIFVSYVTVHCTNAPLKYFIKMIIREFQNNTFFKSREFDGKEYVCTTCHSKLKKGKVPPQAVSNNLKIFDLPESISTLRRLEKNIIAKRILFKRITIMPKGQCPKIKGSICNVPIKADEICNVLPRGMDNNGVVQVALKKKLNFKSNVYLESVRPNIVQDVLSYLKMANPLYANIEKILEIFHLHGPT